MEYCTAIGNDVSDKAEIPIVWGDGGEADDAPHNWNLCQRLQKIDFRPHAVIQ